MLDAEDVFESANDVAFEQEIMQPYLTWSNAPSLADLKQNFNDAKPFRDQAVSNIEKRLAYLHAKQETRPKKRNGFSNVQPRLIRKHAEWRYSALSEPFLSTQDLVSCSPRTHADKLCATQNQLIANYQWNNLLDKQKFVDSLVHKSVDEGTVIVRTGWESQYETVEKEIPIFEYYPTNDRTQMEELQRAGMLREKDPYAFKQHIPEEIQHALALTEQAQQPIYPFIVNKQITTEQKIIKNQPTFEICNARNCYPDPSCKGDLSKAKFFIYAFVTSKAELRASKRYFNIEDLSTYSSYLVELSDEAFQQGGFSFKDEPRKQIVAYEYWGEWDIHNEGLLVPIVATWVGETLIRMEENPYPDKKIPFVSEQYMPVQDDLYGETDGDLLIENQQVVGAVTRGALDLLARSANAQEGMRQDALDAINKRKYQKGENYEFRASVGDPRMAMIQHSFPEMPQSVPLLIQWMNNDAESLSGVRPYTQGLSSAKSLGETAAAVRGVLDAASKRETAILRRIVNLFRKLIRKQISMNGAFLSDEEVVRVTDDEFITIRREDLAGNLDIKIDIATAEEDNAKAQELSFMLQTMGNSMPIELSQLILADIARLRRMPNLAKRIEDYKPQPDPITEAMREAELQKLQAEVAKLQSEVDESRADVGLTNAKTQEAIARASYLSSDTDQKDLDFLEQQSGIKHQRDIEQDRAQAEGNMALEVLKARLGQLYSKPTKS